MIIGTIEKLEIGKIYNWPIYRDILNNIIIKQPWYPIREATKEEWIQDTIEDIGRPPGQSNVAYYYWEIQSD